MKKSLIAIAALAAVGAASAQSSVTLYGLADVNAGHMKTTTTAPTAAGGTTKTVVKSTGLNSGGLQGSRIGVKGVEDLGNGLKAVFNYEMGFDAIDGTLSGNGSRGVGFGRRAVVGLQGDFGSVLIGKDYTPLFNLLGASSVDGLSSFETVGGRMYTARTTGVHYAGNFSGVGVQAFAGYGKTDTATTITNAAGNVVNNASGTGKNQRYGLGLSYANGPFMIGAAAQQFKNSGTGAPTAKSTEAGIGGSYDFGAAKLFANYVQNRDVAGAWKQKDEEFNIGVRAPFGAASVMAGYGHNRSKIYNNGRTVETAKGNDWVVGANYAFSKRTDVYARVGRSDDMKWKNAAGASTGSAKGEFAAVGLRHKF